jgi:Chalcone isomerase-like
MGAAATLSSAGHGAALGLASHNQSPQRGQASMNKRSATTLLLAALLALHAPVQADTRIEGQTFTSSLKLAETELQLNGVGLRAVAWLKAYAAGLYLPRRTRQQDEALAMGGPKRVQLRMLLDGPSQEFVKALDRGVARNTTESEFAGLRDRLSRVTRAIAAVGQVKKGDVIDIDYDPRRGMAFTHNGRLLGEVVDGRDLYPAVLKIFIGDKPVDPELKSGLLGGPVV